MEKPDSLVIVAKILLPFILLALIWLGSLAIKNSKNQNTAFFAVLASVVVTCVSGYFLYLPGW